MNVSTIALPLLTLLFVSLGATAVPAAQTYPLFRKDANIHRFIRGLLRESRWKTDLPYKTGNTGWILNRQLVNVKEAYYERSITTR